MNKQTNKSRTLGNLLIRKSLLLVAFYQVSILLFFLLTIITMKRKKEKRDLLNLLKNFVDPVFALIHILFNRILKRLKRENREHWALNVYIALCYYKLDYYDVALEILQTYLATPYGQNSITAVHKFVSFDLQKYHLF